MAVLITIFFAGLLPFLPVLAALGHFALGGWILYRHRQWLWVPLPLVLLSWLCTMVLAGASALIGVWAQIGH